MSRLSPAGAVALAIALLCAAPAYAASSRATPARILTLREALAIAEQNSLPVAVAESKVAQARKKVSENLAPLYPQLTLGGVALSNRQIDSNAIANFGGVGGVGGLGGLGGFGGGNLGGFGGGGAFNLMQTSLSVSQVLFDGFQTSAALRLADTTVLMTELERANQRRKAGYDVASAYLQALKAEAQREVALKSLSQVESVLDAARKREAAGTGTRLDVLQAQSRLAAAQGQLRAATNGVALARLALDSVLGEPLGDRALDRSGTMPAIAVDLEADLEAAVENRPEVQSLHLKRRIDETAIDLAGKANMPKAQAQIQYQQQGFTSGRSLMGLANVSWPLIDWGRQEAKIAQSREDLRQTDLTLTLARRNIAIDIQSATLSRQDARDRVQIAQTGLQLAMEAFRMAQVRYRAGMGTSLEVLDAETSLAQSQNTLVQATYDAQAAEIRLAQALGVDLPVVLASLEGAR